MAGNSGVDLAGYDMNLTASAITDSPTFYPHKLDVAEDRLLLLRLSAADYRAASFLDDRKLEAHMGVGWVPFAPMAEAAKAIRARPLHFIFHTGHVGSTLLSRLLDEAPGILGLREPLPLRTMADAQDELGRTSALWDAPALDRRLNVLLRLWSRGFADTKAVIVKATSSAGRIAPRILAASPASRAVYLHLAAEPYLATHLAGEDTANDLGRFAGERARRVAAQLGEELPPLARFSPGEAAALSFLAESLSRQKAQDFSGARILVLDFEWMLAELENALRCVLAHFEIPVAAVVVSTIAASPVLTRYSKAPEISYSLALRAAVLSEVREKAGDEIRKGLAWLDAMARRHPAVASIL